MGNIVLGVSGSVAAYRAADLARELMRRGHTVRVCLTDSAEQFVTRALFEALTGQPCLAGVFEEPERGRMAHIDWARWANILVVAPATANVISKLASGVGDDMLTTLAIAFEGPVLVAPAMNPSMYASETTQEALAKLAEAGAFVVEPDDGDVACGENGQGKLASVARIADEVQLVANFTRRLEGKKVVITSGPTREPIDDVRFLSNRSSGKMGAALARAALLMGARVVVVAGPSIAHYPKQAQVVRVLTAVEMRDAAVAAARDANLLIGAAAVSDYRPANPVKGKIRRDADEMAIGLVKNPDVLAEAAAALPQGSRAVGFAAEPSTDVSVAKEKLARKRLYAIAANDVSRADIGFDSERNSLVLITAEGLTEESGVMGKLACAKWLLERVSP